MAQKDKTKEELVEEINSLKERIAEFENSDSECKQRTDEDLQKSEAELRAILDSTPFPVALVDIQDSQIEYWSRSATVIFGHTAPTTAEWYQLVYPDPNYRRQVIERWKSVLEKAKLISQPVNAGEYQVTCCDGSVRICELYASFLPDKLIVTFNDITERKQADEELRNKAAILEAQLNSSIDGILIVDRQGEKILQNYRTIELWKIPQHIVDNNDDKVQVEHVKNMTKNPKKFVEKIVFLYDHPNETSKDEVELIDGTVLDRYSAPVLGKDAKNYGRIWIFRDITERKKLEEELQKRLHEMETFYKVSMGREERIIELKKEVEGLKRKLGK